jgi:O-acetyl-ADP-ribose deacetylase (regulator of RNase III)
VIVNAANSALLGCFRPLHTCIDNAIHCGAGPRLRDDCATIMALQGHAEPTGHAKVTRGHNLPARYVFHTVGPIANGVHDRTNARALARCYHACLESARELGDVRTIAFCGISTGVFGYPKVPACRIALRAVAQWLQANPYILDLIIFNVFSAEDEAIYERELRSTQLYGAVN